MQRPLTDLQLALQKHKYRLDGRDLVNVTAISGLLDDGKSGAFAGAAVKLEKSGVNYREEWNRRADDGTRRHDLCEQRLRGLAVDVEERDKGFLDGLDKFLVEYDPETVELEEIALSSRGYGGRFDMIVRIDGVVWLIDLKTGKKYPIEHTLQLSAYRYADGIGEYSEDGQQIGLRPMPEIERTGCLYVREDGTYDLDEYPADRNAFFIFCKLLDAYEWTRTDEIKAIKKLAKEAA